MLGIKVGSLDTMDIDASSQDNLMVHPEVLQYASVLCQGLLIPAVPRPSAYTRRNQGNRDAYGPAHGWRS